MATLPIAGTAGTAHHLARCIEQDVQAAAAVPEDQKAELLARAKVLAAHALALGDAVERFDESDESGRGITLEGLRARAAGLEAEYQTAWREWGVWQVRHGLRQPEAVGEVFDFGAALGAR